MTPRPTAAALPRLSQTEFIALMAMLFATIAFSIDSMLPALPQIARELSPANVNAAQLIVTSFVLGMGIGTFFAGPLSDAFGRKPVILCGAALYMAGAVAAFFAPTLEVLLAARILQGLGAAAPRVVSFALVRDMFTGRDMARVISFAMMIFTLVPAVAPMVGSVIIDAFGWRALFVVFVLFSAVSCLWLGLRQPETLPVSARRPLHFATLLAAVRETLSHRVIVLSILVQATVLGMLFATLSSTQMVFDVTFGKAETFPYWFALIAVLAGSANLVNARLVVRLGMRFLVTTALGTLAAFSAMAATLMGLGLLPEGFGFPVYLAWTIAVFFTTGMSMGNLSALALEPVGHIAGMASSVLLSLATVAAVLLAVPVGLAFDGTPVPLMLAGSVLAAFGFALTRLVRPDRTTQGSGASG